MKRKYYWLINVLLIFGCHEYMPPGITPQFKAEDYLDSLYRPDTVGIKIGMGYITLKDYATPLKRRAFQQNTDLNKVSTIHWDDFTKKTNDIISKAKDRSKGSIVILNYHVHRTEHTTAFFIDSSVRKVFDTIQIK
ncbi:hypothetical protein [Mucilaginibacter sp.]|uniref:hypothetical protein n=1 Tax=Mucilaginibacter sp. TaxID=1882438 RepID=UPI003D0C3CAB